MRRPNGLETSERKKVFDRYASTPNLYSPERTYLADAIEDGRRRAREERETREPGLDSSFTTESSFCRDGPGVDRRRSAQSRIPTFATPLRHPVARFAPGKTRGAFFGTH